MLPDDVTAAAEIHLRSFPGFFLSFLGPSFLKEFYRNMVDSPFGVAIVVCCQNEVAGLACGSYKISAFYRDFIKTRWLNLSLAALPSVVKKPSTAVRLMRAIITRPGFDKDISIPGELSSIAVDPEWEGRGLGRALLTAFLQRMKSSGCTEMTLDTDRDNNERVNAFYLRNGFTLAGTDRTPEGRWMNRYIIKL
jgi:ribosomal protein S18 acetylase RimI-like enzyme